MNYLEIEKVVGREILDSRGNPTVECKLTLENNMSVYALVPSGASTGEREALELRDGGTRFHGKGVLKACENVNKKIAPKIVGKDVSKQKEIDEIMLKLDGTDFKTKLWTMP